MVTQDLEITEGGLPAVKGHALICAPAVMLVTLWKDAIKGQFGRCSAPNAAAAQQGSQTFAGFVGPDFGSLAHAGRTWVARKTS